MNLAVYRHSAPATPYVAAATEGGLDVFQQTGNSFVFSAVQFFGYHPDLIK
jgi:hypothetical protein